MPAVWEWKRRYCGFYHTNASTKRGRGDIVHFGSEDLGFKYVQTILYQYTKYTFHTKYNQAYRKDRL